MAVLDIKLESLICPEAPLPDSYRAAGERLNGQRDQGCPLRTVAVAPESFPVRSQPAPESSLLRGLHLGGFASGSV